MNILLQLPEYLFDGVINVVLTPSSRKGCYNNPLTVFTPAFTNTQQRGKIIIAADIFKFIFSLNFRGNYIEPTPYTGVGKLSKLRDEWAQPRGLKIWLLVILKIFKWYAKLYRIIVYQSGVGCKLLVSLFRLVLFVCLFVYLFVNGLLFACLGQKIPWCPYPLCRQVETTDVDRGRLLVSKEVLGTDDQSRRNLEVSKEVLSTDDQSRRNLEVSEEVLSTDD